MSTSMETPRDRGGSRGFGRAGIGRTREV